MFGILLHKILPEGIIQIQAPVEILRYDIGFQSLIDHYRKRKRKIVPCQREAGRSVKTTFVINLKVIKLRIKTKKKSFGQRDVVEIRAKRQEIIGT